MPEAEHVLINSHPDGGVKSSDSFRFIINNIGLIRNQRSDSYFQALWKYDVRQVGCPPTKLLTLFTAIWTT